MKEKHGFKVLHHRPDGILVSAIMGNKPTTGMSQSWVEYQPNKLATPQDKCGPLCVFDTKAAADHFRLTKCENSEIWSCIYQPSRRRSIWTPEAGKWNIYHFEVTWLTDTKLADGVIILERVSP